MKENEKRVEVGCLQHHKQGDHRLHKNTKTCLNKESCRKI